VDQIANEPRFRVCPGCGNLVPIERADCPYCGFASVEALAARQEAAKERRFFKALFTRSSPFTFFIIGLNVGIFALEWLAGGMSAMSADTATIIAFGAKVNDLIDYQHQYWRFITANFIHIGFLHVLLNNYALYIIGQEIERIYGSARFVILYLVTGVIGVLASYSYSDSISAGASSSIFGLFGVMATFAFWYRKEIPELLGKEIRRRVLPVIAINLVFGFSVQIVDNAAHVGGLLSGVALALVIPYKRPQERATPPIWRALQVALLLITAASFVMAFINYNGPRPSLANLSRSSGGQAVEYFERMRDAQAAFITGYNLVLQRFEGDSNDSAVRSAVKGLEDNIKALNEFPSVNAEADGFRRQLGGLLDEQKSILTADSQGPGERERLMARHAALNEKAEEFFTQYRPWLTRFMREHGYELRQEKPDGSA
jgi:membrane associated rhomboid family serine protease